MNRILIDGDILAYTVFQLEETIMTDTFLGPVEQKVSAADWPMKKRIDYIDNQIQEWCDKFNTTDYVVCMTDPVRANLFRYHLADQIPYKENRKNKPKPEGYHDIVDYLYIEHNALHKDTWEADDLLSVLDGIAITIDKDNRGSPGMLYIPTKDRILHIKDPGRLKLYRTSWRKKPTTEIIGTGFAWFCAQMIIGDQADNIDGILGMGPVATYKLLKGCKSRKEYWDKVKTCYEEHDRLHLLEETADLLFILREPGKTWRDLI